jgi:hypothetical protein
MGRVTGSRRAVMVNVTGTECGARDVVAWHAEQAAFCRAE